MFYIILPMTGFEPQTSGSGSRRFATLATPRLGQVWLKIKPVSLVPCQGELKSWSSVFAFVIKYSGRWRFQVRGNQCDQIWQIFATLANVYKSLTNFDGLFLIWQNDDLLWKICDIIGLIFSVAYGQILKNHLTIRSHWRQSQFWAQCDQTATSYFYIWPFATVK